MKKESILAIVMGIVLGIGVGTVILSRTAQADKQKIETAKTTGNENLKTNRPATSTTSFTVSEPSTGATVSTNKVTIKGKAAKGSLLIVQSQTFNDTVKLEKDDFSVDVPLALGENVIGMSLYPVNGGTDYQEKTMYVYYLPNE